MKTLLFAASIVALSTAAHAGMSCNLNDQRGNVLQDSFALAVTATPTRSS
jgi:hypothetical protein